MGTERVGACERLLLDVIDGRLNLFVRSDEQDEAWRRWVEHLLNHCSGDAQPLRLYAAGTLGANCVQRDECMRWLLLGRRIMSCQPC